MSPSVILALLFVSIGTSVARLIAPARARLPLALLCAAAGVLAGELVALAGRGGPALGSVHPLTDVIGVAAFETAGLALASPRRVPPR